MTKNRKRFRFCAYPFSPSTVASIRETDARWKKQWGHDERRTLTGCGYCFDGGNPVIGHFRNPRGASRKKKEREKKYQCDIFDIYIYIYTRACTLYGCDHRFKWMQPYSNATFSNVCRKNGAQRGGGILCFSFFRFFLFLEVCSEGWVVFAFDTFVPPSPFFPIHPSKPLIRALQKLGCV